MGYNIEMENISFSDFKKLDIRIATIKNAEVMEEADKLLKLTLDLGPGGERVVAAGIAQTHSPESLIGKQVPMLANLEPRVLRGIESQGMILAATENGKAVLLHPEKDIEPGTQIK